MATNVTLRDIVNYPGGTAKTVTLDITQIVPAVGDPLEGDEIWVSSATTTATASGGGSIENIYKNQMKRGFLKSSGLASSTLAIPALAKFKVAIDEAIGEGVDITLTEEADPVPLPTIAADIETKIRLQAEIGLGGSKVGNLSYLNAQVRVVGTQFSIESGTLATVFTGAGKSSVVVGAPDTGTDVRWTLGFDITTSSETLASRGIVEDSLASTYTTGDLLVLNSTTGFAAGNAIIIQDGTNSQVVVASGVGVTDLLPAAQIRFVTQSGASTGLETTYSGAAIGPRALVRLLHEVDVADPVSPVTTVDQLYRFSIDSLGNQIDFSA